MELIAPWAEEGKLPNLARIMKDGVWGNLRSTIPYITTTAWSSFATGLNPGKHGIFDFYQHIPNSFDIYFTNSGVRRGKTIWRRTSEAGKKVCIINVPMTYPPEPVNGVIISGMDAPGTAAQFTHPSHIYQEMKDAIGEYIIDMHFDEIVANKTPKIEHYAEYLELLSTMVDNRCRATEYLMEKYPSDLLATVFVATDRSQHQFWKFMDSEHPGHSPADARILGDAIYKIYLKCDQALGRILEKMDQDTSLLIMSDHGAGPGHRVFYVRTWLRANGLLVLKKSRRGAASVWKTGFKLGKRLLPSHFKRRMKQRIGADKLLGMRLFLDVNWEKTQAYSEGVCGNIFINLKGREPHGIVEPGDEYEALCREITANLMQTKDPKTGKNVVRRVYRKEELYSGPLAQTAPDLTVEGFWEYHCRGDSFSKEASVGDNALFSDAPLSGTHKINGAFLGLGPHFAKGKQITQAALIDIAPTVLYLLGMDIPRSLDGKVLSQAFNQDYLAEHPVRLSEEADEDVDEARKDIYSSTEKQQIEDRLRGLGYLE